jgi:hypothetical protein
VRNCSWLAAGAHADRDDFGGDPFLFQANRFFDGDFAEGVDGHFDVVQVDAGLVREHPNLDIGINDALYRDKNLHDVPFPN